MDAQALINALRDRARKFVSLDNPEDSDLGDLAIDIGAGFVPVVGTATSGRDFERARRENDKLGMVLSAAGMIPVVGGVAGAANKARKGATAAAKVNLRKDGQQIASRLDAEKRFGDGDRIFAVHEMGGKPVEITSMDMLNKYSPDQLMAVSTKAAEAANDLSAPAVVKALRTPKQTVDNPQRVAYPGIYKRPDVIAREASEMVAPENPMLKRLFGVTREDLYEMSKARTGNIEPRLPGAAANPKGSAAAQGVMNRRNENRILNTLGEAEKYPDLYKGMVGWYVMDPAFQRLKALVGEEEAIARYSRMNNLSGMASPGSDVLTEFNRGTAANWLANEGRFDDFVKYAGMPAAARTGAFPEDMRAVMGHPYHKTAQATPMQKYLEKGELDMASPKVPMYIQASGVPETGFQTRMPVGDAHWSRAVGLGDTRTNQAFGASVSNPEMSQLGPWWRDRIAAKVGLESVPAQALAWGTFAKQTGVDTPVGAPKLELLAQQIEKASRRMNVSPETARDLILTGKAHAGYVDPMLAAGLAAGAGGAATIAALRNRKKEDEEQIEP